MKRCSFCNKVTKERIYLVPGGTLGLLLLLGVVDAVVAQGVDHQTVRVQVHLVARHRDGRGDLIKVGRGRERINRR